MSGIFGFYSKNNNEQHDISSMLPWNRLYGNGAEGIISYKGISLGCCIESISDEHIQTTPVFEHDGFRCVVDAIIYNRDELIDKCRTISSGNNAYAKVEQFANNNDLSEKFSKEISDAELLVTYINLYGLDELKNVNGDFSGVIYNTQSHELILFRDHMGIRPLYYYLDDDAVVFSTDLRGLIAQPQLKANIDEEWVYKTVSGYDTETVDNTPYEKIKCVTPASYISFNVINDKIVSKKTAYWRLGQNKIRLSSRKEYTDRLRELVTDSVKRRLAATSGIVGAELSGGMDSGVIDILINREGRDGVYFSWSMDPSEVEYAQNDERLIINDICKQEGINCNFMHSHVGYAKKATERISMAGIDLTDEGAEDFRFAFLPDTNTYTMMYGAQFVKDKGSKVLFTGHGGDEGVSHRCNIYELFYHHEYYYYWRNVWSLTQGKFRIPRTLKRGFKNITSSIKENRETYLNWFASPQLLKSDFSGRFQKKKENNLKFAFDSIGYIEDGGSRNRLDNMALFGACSQIRYLAPFMDYRVIDYAVSIPRHLYIKNGIKRYIFRQAFKDIMPKSLYRCNAKESTSDRNIKSNENWYEDYKKRKLEIINALDREYWSKYLDFEKIDAFAAAGKPSDEEYLEELKQIKALQKCALAQNVINKAKESSTR